MNGAEKVERWEGRRAAEKRGAHGLTCHGGEQAIRRKNGVGLGPGTTTVLTSRPEPTSHTRTASLSCSSHASAGTSTEADIVGRVVARRGRRSGQRIPSRASPTGTRGACRATEAAAWRGDLAG